MSSRTALVLLASLLCACNGSARPALVPDAAPPPIERSANDLAIVLRHNPKLVRFVDDASGYRLQVLLSVPSPSPTEWLRRERFRPDAEYVYPASAIKLCVAVAALETVGELRSTVPELDVNALLVTEATKRSRSVRQLVDAALVMSDNDASNDLFELAGYDGLHQRMWSLGLSTFRMRHRLGIGSRDDARVTPAMTLTASGHRIPIPAREGRIELASNDQNGVLVGRSYVSHDGRLIEEPLSFEAKNSVSLWDLQQTLVAVVRPDLAPESKLALGPEEHATLLEALTTLPTSRGLPREQDVAHKPLLAGIERVIPRASLTLASKSGRAYGFLVDNAYVRDARTGREFFLAATLYTNPNGVINDDRYAYRAVAFPAFADLAEVVTRYVLDE